MVSKLLDSMCRMFGYHGSSMKEVESLREALIKSAQRDTTHHGRVHGDGHGYAIVSEDAIHIYKSTKPIYEDTVRLPHVEGEFLAIFHARNAFPRRMGKSYTHPYVESGENSTIILAHNGSLHRTGLVPELGVDNDRLVVESELGLKFLVKKGLSQETINGLMAYTRTAVNLILVELKKEDDSAKLYYLNHYAEADKPENQRYYKLYVSEFPHGTAVFSSTLRDYGIGGAHGVREGKLELLGELAYAQKVVK